MLKNLNIHMKPLMPKATAVWLIDNTSLTFLQIADFCFLHPLEVKGIADGDVAKGIVGMNPIANHQLTEEEIKRCESNPDLRLKMPERTAEILQQQEKKKKKTNYVPLARRSNKPHGILWVLKNFPNATDAQIAKLLSTTKTTVDSIREKRHANYANIKPKDPVMLGLCSQKDINTLRSILEENSPKTEESQPL